MKTKKNLYRELRTNPKKNKMVDYVKVPVFTKKQKKEVTVVLRKTIDDGLIELFKRRDVKLSPKNDFYSFVNEIWLKNVNKRANHRKTFYVKQDNIRIIQEDTAYSFLKTMKLDSKQQKVFDSFKKMDSSHMSHHIGGLKISLQELFSRNNFYELMAFMHETPLFSSCFPLIWDMNVDLKNPKIYCNTISSCNLTFFDFAFYEKIPAGDKKRYKYQQELYKKYEIYIKDIFKSLGINVDYKEILECEKRLVKCFEGTMEEDESDYNKISLLESQKLGFDWSEFTRLMKFPKTPNWYIVSSINYLSNVMKLMQEWNTPKWHNYWYFICMKQMIKFSKNLSKIEYEFNGKFIAGVVKPLPDELMGMRGLTLCYNTFLSQHYCKYFEDGSVVSYVTTLTEELRTTFINILLRNKWLTPSSKKEALLKVRHLKFTIGTINSLTPDPELEYTNDLWYNLKLQYSYYLAKTVTYTDKPYIIDNRSIDWQTYPYSLAGNQNYVVNAFYTPSENGIFIPLGIMQNPFIVMDESFEYNLASIGYTIAHEMSHSLDDLGSKYDYKGILKNWWSLQDRRHFDKYIKDVVNEYEEFAKRDGITWDATNSAGEDIADISGLFILEEYLRNKLFLNNELLEIDVLKLKLFFTYFALQNSQGIYEGAIPMLLITNPHPLNKYRVNCPLARVKLFQYIYNIKPGDKMYWSNTNKLW
jgi:putative endopeptidase